MPIPSDDLADLSRVLATGCVTFGIVSFALAVMLLGALLFSGCGSSSPSPRRAARVACDVGCHTCDLVDRVCGCDASGGEAHELVRKLPRNAERSTALRKLLEGKDAAVRAALPADSP